MKIEDRINSVLDTIRPFLINDGGNIEFVEYNKEQGILYIKMQGACADCFSLDFTLNEIIKQALQDEIPEIKDVINI